MFTQMIIFAQPLLKIIIIHLLEKQYIIMIMIFQVDIKVLKNGKKYYMKILAIWEIVINSKGYLCNSFMIRFQKDIVINDKKQLTFL